MNYVCGFLFSFDLQQFVLIKKERGPENMAGKWNGIGGKIKIIDNEIASYCMSREFQEETGVLIRHSRWRCFTIEEYQHTKAKIFYFAAFGDEILKVKTTTDEEIRIFSQEDFAFYNRKELVHNIPYLIQMIITNIQSGYFNMLNPQGINSI